MKLFPHQVKALELTRDYQNCAYYLDMGLGKTFIGSERLIEYGLTKNLVVCQKSKVDDWLEHFTKYYSNYSFLNLTNKKEYELFVSLSKSEKVIGIINYDLIYRRKELLKLTDFTLMLDESSKIKNKSAKRTKFILKLKPSHVILLSGTPSSGKYENMWTQAHLLGWPISNKLFDSHYVNFKKIYIGGAWINTVNMADPYKNEDRLKEKLRQHGAIYMKSEDVIELPEQTFIEVPCKTTREYKTFVKTSYLKRGDDLELVGDTNFTKRLYEKMLCSAYNPNKLEVLEDLIDSTQDRIVIFYQFNNELDSVKILCEKKNRPISLINGTTKDLSNYENSDDSITCVQYQSGAMGLNLQKANKIIYFSLPESSDLFEQSKKRIHRIGQAKPCFYYLLICKDSIEEKIYERLKQLKDYDDYLFKGED